MSEIRTHVFATTTEIADGLLFRRWRADHREHARSIQLGELARISAIRLDPLARLARNERRSNDLAHDRTRRFESPLKRIPAGPRLVADADLSPASVALQAPHEPADGSLVVLQREFLRLLPPRMENRDDQRLLVRVHPDPRDTSLH